MEMEMQIPEIEAQAAHNDLGFALERLNAAASLLERASAREAILEQRLAAAEADLQTLRAAAASAPQASAARKTAPTGTASMVSRDGVAVDAGALDASLRSLSIEQRIAVKAEMLRAGLLT